MSIHKLFYPRGVALVGSTSEGKLGYYIGRQILDGGYEKAYAVNPRAQGLGPIPGYSSVADIGQEVDLAVVVAPPQAIVSVLEDCALAGVQTAVIITAGFSEVGNHSAEEELARAADRLGIRFVGPNCAGIINTHHHLTPTLETLPPQGGVSLIAQSGAVGGVFLAWAKEFGLGVSKFVSYGNGADLREIELLHYLSDDPDTTVVALYIESVSDGREFMEAVRECTRIKPVVVIKTGRTESGRRATLSHTGSMAGADAVYDAALAQCGALRVNSIEELFDLCKVLAWLPPIQGDRVAIVTNSGGPGVMAADRAEEIGLRITEPHAATREELAAFLPPQCALRNPIDLTVEGTEEGYRRTLLALLEDYDAALALNIAPAYLDSIPLARGVCDAAEASGKPVVAAFLPARIVKDAVPVLQERGIPNLGTGERAVAALHGAIRCSDIRRNWRPLVRPEPPVGSLPGSGQMLEHQALDWLEANGIPVPDHRFASSAEEAARASAELGYPVVLKLVSAEILHKSDVGGVELDVQDGDAAKTAYSRLQRAAGDRDFRGVVIYPMIRGAQEVLLGLSRDPQFGPVVAFGLGGTQTEVWRDICLRVAPIDREQAEGMIREIRSFPLLDGFRGAPPCDLGAVADMLVKLSQLGFRYPDIAEIDLNPVFASPSGSLVGDIRVIRR